MCGICGELVLDGSRPADRDLVRAMVARLRHRGPDDEGVAVDGPVALGAARLSIIDVAGGHQPVSNEDGTVRVVQNGEIYNYRELRERLSAAGHRFASRGDTEVLAHLYEEEGPGFVRSLRGMFAVAVWDARARRLVLARDRLGIKPLFYAATPERVLFASEIKGLLAAGLPRRIDPLALHDYLSFDYVPGPRTMFEGIAKLPAGHVLVREDGVPVRIERFWDFPPQAPPGDPAWAPDAGELRAGLRDRLEDAVRATMESDVPVGAFLSGGLDSSIVVAMMSRWSSGPVRTFSVGFRERSYNELPFARLVAERYATEHTEIVVEPDVLDVVPRLIDAFDEPFADSSAIAAWYVSQAAAGEVKVVLSGDGGDEVFGGYVIYQADRLASLYRRLPGVLAERAIPGLVGRLPTSHGKMSLDLKMRRFVAHARRDPVSAHASWRVIFTDEMKAALYGARPSPVRDSLEPLREAHAAYPGPDALNRFLVLDARVSLVDDMLTKVDRTSMAHGLEVRVPLLDHLLVEWMTRVPGRFKVRRLELKHLLKVVARDLLPREVVDRPKAGFHVPMPAWLTGPLRPLVEEHLGAGVVARQGLFDPAIVGALWAEHASGRRDHSRNLWGLLVLGLWYDRHIERHGA